MTGEPKTHLLLYSAVTIVFNNIGPFLTQSIVKLSLPEHVTHPRFARMM